jgi:hypothetical protein
MAIKHDSFTETGHIYIMLVEKLMKKDHLGDLRGLFKKFPESINNNLISRPTA